MNNTNFSLEIKNHMKLNFPSLSINEGISRIVTSAFCAQLDPVPTELADIKCAVSEAVTNCIVHAYHDKAGIIYMTLRILKDGVVRIDIRDRGCGIPDVKKAREPLYTTDAAGERSGMGFTVMESFMDKLKVSSRIGKGTTVTMYKKISGKSDT